MGKNNKKEILFKDKESLQQVVNVINEASAAISDKNRTIKDSSISAVLTGAQRCDNTINSSFVEIYKKGLSSTIAAGFAAAGIAATSTVIGGTIVAGACTLAAPLIGAAAAGVGVKKYLLNKQLHQEKERLYPIALKKQLEITQALKEETSVSKERIDYLKSLSILLNYAAKDLEKDLGVSV